MARHHRAPRKHGQYGIEARILCNEEHRMSHTFAPWHTVPFATPRGAAIHWAEGERHGDRARRRLISLVDEESKGKEMTDKQRNRLLLISVGIALVLVAIAQHFGWIAAPPPVLAPGVQ